MRFIEQLNKELKRWLPLEISQDEAKVAKALMALRNYDGGQPLLGIDDKTGRPVKNNMPENLERYYSIDKFQNIASKYARQKFEITVEHKKNHVVIIVPGGIEEPVYCKKDVKDNKNNFILKKDEIYTRTLNANNLASSAQANAKDIADIIKRCENNKKKLYKHTAWASVSLVMEKTYIILRSAGIESIVDEGYGIITLNFTMLLPRYYLHDVKFMQERVKYHVRERSQKSLTFQFENEPGLIFIAIDIT